MAVVEESGEGIDVGTASATSCNDLVGLDRHVVLGVVESSVGLNDKGEWKLGLLEEGVCRRDGIQRRANVLGRAVCVGRGGYAGL